MKADLLGLGLLRNQHLSSRLDYAQRQIEELLDANADQEQMRRAIMRLDLALPSFVRDARAMEDRLGQLEARRLDEGAAAEPRKVPWWRRSGHRPI